MEFWPTGRVQQIDDRFKPKKAKGKPEFGRNELIARWMGQELGYEIKRKEISSHLQVLKAKFRGEVAKDDFGGSNWMVQIQTCIALTLTGSFVLARTGPEKTRVQTC